MNKLDILLNGLRAEGKITTEEALAIGASIRFTSILTGTAKLDFLHRYGREARDAAYSLLSPVTVLINWPEPISKKALDRHHAAQIRQQQQDGA